MNTVGMYCTYLNDTWLILRRTNDLVLIINIDDVKKQVKLSNVTLRLDLPKAVEVINQESKYLVTPKHRIYSMLSNKRMHWSADNGKRVQIVKDARKMFKQE